MILRRLSNLLSVSAILAFPLFINACGSISTNSNIQLATSGGSEDIGFEPGANLDPADGTTPVDPGAEPACAGFESLSITPSTIDFGLKQLEDKECQHIALNGCVPFSAEIVYVEDTADEAKQFSFFDSTGAELSGRQANLSEGVDVCYKRTEIGAHRGRANIVIEGDSVSYATAIPLTGSTEDYVFNLSSPTDGMLVWEQDGISTFDAATSKFTIPVAGTVNTDLSSIITGNQVTVSGGITSQTLDASSNSFSGTFDIPSTPEAVHPITISIPSNKGDLKMVRNVIRYTRPAAKLEIRNITGNRVNSTETSDADLTDSQKLTLGINVTNLNVSGPTEEKNILTTVKIINADDTAYMFYNADDQEWTADPDDAKAIEFYKGYAEKEDVKDVTTDGENGHCGDKYESPLSSYCVSLPPTADLQKGLNIVETTMCNDYTTFEGGCVVVTTTIIVDNDVPVITISSPAEDRVYSTSANADKITATITVDNFIMKDIKTEVDETTKVETTTETCAVKLWLNNSILQNPIELCDHVKQIVASEDGSTSNGNNGNIRRAIFEVVLDDLKNDSPLHALTLYTNLLHVDVHDINNHFAYKTVSFQRGENKHASYTNTGSGEGSLNVGPMGNYTASGAIKNAPIMLYVGEDTVQEEQIKNVLRKALNDNFSFATLAMNLGFTFDNKEEKLDELGTFGIIDPSTKDISKIIKMLHKSAPEQVMAIKNLQQAYDDNNKYFTPDEAQDMCGFPITTAIVTPDILENIYARWNVAPDYITKNSVWPKKICGDDLDCKNGQPIQGIWDIDIDLKDDGYLDVSLILNGKENEDGVKQPAFAGHFLAYNLIAGGSTQAYTLPVGLSDPTIPLYFNVAKLTLSLKDVLRIYKAQKNDDGTLAMCDSGRTQPMGLSKVPVMEPCECTNNNCTNVVFAAPDKIQDDKSDYMTIKLDPYSDCAEYFKGRWPDANLPYGCNEKAGKSTAVGIDSNSTLGLSYYSPTGEGNYNALIEQVLSVLDHTFRNTVGCLPNSMVNPMIDSEAFPYASWVPKTDRNNLNFAVGTDKDGEMAFGFKQDLIDDGSDIAFSLKPNLKDAEIAINDGGALVKVGAEIGADGVDSAIYNSGDATTRAQGYMFREPENLKDYPLGQEEVHEKPYLSLSLNMEEVANGALYTLIEKGLWDTLKLVGFDDELTGPPGYSFDNWTIGVDKVILGRFGICGKLTPEASADLAPSLLFASISGLFKNDEGESNGIMHLDVSLKHAPTLALLPVEGDPEATLLQVGLPNVEITPSSLIPVEVGNKVQYKVGPPVVTVRADIILKIILKYSNTADGKKALDIYLLPRDQQTIYFSVLNRGETYDDSQVTSGLSNTVLPLTLDPISGIFDPTNPAIKPGFQLIMPHSVTDEIELIKNVSPPTPEDCTDEEGDDEPEYYKPTIELNGKWADLFINFWKSLVNALQAQADANDAEEVSQAPTTSTMFAEYGEIRNPGIAGLLSAEGSTYSTDVDPCDFLEDEVVDPDNKTLAEQTKESLCDFGIENAFIENPELQFDFKNGYIHFGTGLGVELYDWAIEEVSPYPNLDDESEQDLQMYERRMEFNPSMLQQLYRQ